LRDSIWALASATRSVAEASVTSGFSNIGIHQYVGEEA
jgi:hypothetical protein